MNRPEKLHDEVWSMYKNEIGSELLRLQTKHQELISRPVLNYPDIRRHPDGTIAGSVNLLDALYLYALVRYFKPKVIFEVGTWTGMSAMFMAEAIRKNGGGHIYTCDINNYYLLGDSYQKEITRINSPSAEAINNLPTDDLIDMVFLDGDVDDKTILPLLKRLCPQPIIATHDFTFPGEKGVSNLVGIQKISNHVYSYVRPNIPVWIQSKTDTKSTSIRFLIQTHKSTWRDRILTAWYKLTIIIGAIYRRCKRLVA